MLRAPLFYNPENPENIVTGSARMAFLNAIAKDAPDVLKALRDYVLPEYHPIYLDAHVGRGGGWRILPDGYRETIHHDDMYRWSELRRAASDNQPEMVPLKKALRGWAKVFHLGEDWIMDIALDTMRGWERQNVEPHHRIGWANVIVHWEEPIENQPFVFIDTAGWMPSWEARQEFKDRVLQKVAADLDQYLGQREAATINAAWQKTPMKRVREHFAWLVRYQVMGWSYYKIAAEFSQERNTVRGGVIETASLLSLTLQSSGGAGRPKTT